MKRLKIETADKIYYAKPLTLGQLEENEVLMNEIFSESGTGVNLTKTLPLTLLKKQGQIVLIALQNHDKDISETVISGFSYAEVVQAFAELMSGSGLEEVPEGEAGAR